MNLEMKNNEDAISMTMHNIVRADSLRSVQSKTLKYLKEALKCSYGPFGSDTVITKNSADKVTTIITKDGRTILESILFGDTIEQTTLRQVQDVTYNSDHEVGDGTTSAVLMASEAFDGMCNLSESITSNAYELRRKFISVCNEIKEEILKHKIDFNPDAAYNITKTSTNGNTIIAEQIKNIYLKYGNDVDINVETSVDNKTYLKSYDGMVLESGIPDPVYVTNKAKMTCEISNPKIYSFVDPIDTPPMAKLFKTIIDNNIILPLSQSKFNEMIPTIIITPKFGYDIENDIARIAAYIGSAKENGIPVPFLIVTNFHDPVGSYQDIIKICGCKPIKKYIDKGVYEQDIETGIAATPENVIGFAGSAELVVADSVNTRFINPTMMYTDNGEYTAEWKSLVEWLESQVSNATILGNDATETYNYKKRLASLKSNLVDLYIGGVSTNDRDQTRDLVEDAVRNCKSASKYGVGFGANFEGLRASKTIMDKHKESSTEFAIAKILYDAFYNVVKALYDTSPYIDNDKMPINCSLINECPFDVTTGEAATYCGYPTVATSIMTDATIVESISKLVALMFGCNQLLTPSALTNKWIPNFQL